MNFILSLMLFSFALKASAQSLSPVDITALANISDVAVVTPGVLYRGPRFSLPSPALEKMAQAGMRTVINLQGGDGEILVLGKIIRRDLEPGESWKVIGDERNFVESLQMKFLNFPINSIEKITPSEDSLIKDTLTLMKDSSNYPIYIHCEHGHDRTGLLVALFRVKVEKTMTPAQAHAEMVLDGHKGKLDQLVTGSMDAYFCKETGFCGLTARR